MKCSNIIEMSLYYNENRLNAKEKDVFESHIARCEKCRSRYNLFTENYFPVNTNQIATDEIITGITSRVDRNRYNKISPAKVVRRTFIAVFVSVLLLAGIVANADTISKSINELITLIGREINPQALKEMAMARQKSPLEAAGDIYEKHKDEVYKESGKMKVGDCKELNFKWDGVDFIIKVGKTSKITAISYKTAELDNFIIGNSIRESLKQKNSEKVNLLLKNLIDSGYFVPVLEPIPEGYRLESVEYDGKSVNSVHYRTTAGNGFISVKMESSVIKNIDSERSLEEINGYQAVYQEREVYGERHDSINIYLGDEKKQKTVSMSAYLPDNSVVTKDYLLKIANGIKFYNERNNIESGINNVKELKKETRDEQKEDTNKYSVEHVFNGEIFKDIKDPGIISKLEEYKSRIKEGQLEFTIPVAEGIAIKRFSRFPEESPRYFYSINYKIGDFDDVKRYMIIPLLMNRNIYNEAVFEYASYTGADVNASAYDSGVHYQFLPAGTPGNQTEKTDKLQVHASCVTEEEKLWLKDFTVTDLIVDRYISANFDSMNVQLVFDKDSNPYIVAESADHSTTQVQTIKEINGEYISYYIEIPDSMIKNMDSQTLINGFGLIY